MHLSGSVIKLAVSPDVPHDIIDETFEGALIRRMIRVQRTKDGYELCSNSGVDVAAVNLDELVKLAGESESRFAQAALPLLRKAIEEDEPLFLDEFGEALEIEDFDIAHVLEELCRMYPERITHFEIAWAEVTSTATPDFGRLGGGADFVTADGIESINAKSWLDEKRAAFKLAREFNPGSIWERVEGRDIWRAMCPHSDWVEIIENIAPEYFQIARVNDEYVLTRTGVSKSPTHFADREQAFRTANELYARLAGVRREEVLSSMGLNPREWKLDVGNLAATNTSTDGPSKVIAYEDGRWALYVGENLLTTGDEPQELIERINEAASAFKA
jgi:hypothetical protein